MIVGTMEETLLRIYLCRVCGKKWCAPPGVLRVNCLVAHAPGTCCHYGEAFVPDSVIEKITEAIKEFREAQP